MAARAMRDEEREGKRVPLFSVKGAVMSKIEAGCSSVRALLLLTVMAAVLVGGCGFTSTSPGEAVVFSRFGDVAPTCFPAGFYLHNPLTTSVYHVDVKVQKFEVKADASSRDLQNVHTTIVVNFSVDGKNCHELIKNVGANFVQQIILPAVEEVTKASTALFPVEKVIQERPKLKRKSRTD